MACGSAGQQNSQLNLKNNACVRMKNWTIDVKMIFVSMKTKVKRMGIKQIVPLKTSKFLVCSPCGDTPGKSRQQNENMSVQILLPNLDTTEVFLQMGLILKVFPI